MRAKLIFATLLSTALTLVGPTCAWAGGGSDGGGNDLVAAFVDRANELLAGPQLSAADKQTIRSALESSKIESVAVLRDAETGQPVPNQTNLVAWGSRGRVQLKDTTPPGGDSWRRVVDENRQENHIVIHELFRASGQLNENGVSVDDSFQKSIGTYHLNEYSQHGLFTSGDLVCNEGLISGKIMVSAGDKRMLMSDLLVGGEVIQNANVKTFIVDDTRLLISAPGFALKAKMPIHAHGQASIGVRTGVALIKGKKVSVWCNLPELDDIR